MRAKYGFRRQISDLAHDLTDAELLLMMAAVEAPSTAHAHHRGLLALTDHRLLFLPTLPEAGLVEAPLTEVSRVDWVPNRASGALTVLTHGATLSFTAVATGDGRELTSAITRLRPSMVDTPAR